MLSPARAIPEPKRQLCHYKPEQKSQQQFGLPETCVDGLPFRDVGKVEWQCSQEIKRDCRRPGAVGCEGKDRHAQQAHQLQVEPLRWLPTHRVKPTPGKIHEAAQPVEPKHHEAQYERSVSVDPDQENQRQEPQPLLLPLPEPLQQNESCE